ncbi:hypothetical protein GCK32_001143 [Trichostrongylus colubriformis]|uniref:Uncharacterized protein n=1 Tax=Trichostrongylus colubriformis TaxID=6319 RepID=A0AAN8GDJ5_TRICO
MVRLGAQPALLKKTDQCRLQNSSLLYHRPRDEVTPDGTFLTLESSLTVLLQMDDRKVCRRISRICNQRQFAWQYHRFKATAYQPTCLYYRISLRLLADRF